MSRVIVSAIVSPRRRRAESQGTAKVIRKRIRNVVKSFVKGAMVQARRAESVAP